MPTLFLIVLVDLIGFGIIIPLLPFYAEHYQAEPHTVALLMATYSFTQLLSAPLWGGLSDRVGRRPVFLVSLAGAAVSYVWLGLAGSLGMLFAARAFGGAMAGNISAAFAYVADVTQPADRAKGMGLVGAAFSLGFIAGPAIGGLLAGPDPATANYQLPAMVAAGLSALALILTLVLLKELLPPERRGGGPDGGPRRQWFPFAGALRQRQLRYPIILIFLATFVFAGIEATFAMWSERTLAWGPLQNGYLFAFVGILSAVVQAGLMGRLVRRFGETHLVLQGAAALAVGSALIPLSQTLSILIPAMVILAYGFSVIMPALNSLISLNAAAEDQGSIMGIGRSVSMLARVIGPAWAGMLFSVLGKDWPYVAGAMVMAGVLVLGGLALRHTTDKSP